jgi:asparagine synthase (glutamine-hydrolysing)
MFAFAVWDRQSGELTLGRDRLGEKPLYYGWQGRGNDAVFLFGSELKALREHPAFENIINRDALCLLLRHNCIPAPHSIYEGIAKLSPGSLLTVSRQLREPKVLAYWSGAQVAESGVANAFVGSPEQAVDTLEILLKDAVRQQMMADVPLGAFLSGGVDSSAIVALMQAQTSRPVKTFTIGFNEEGYNEAVHSKAVAAHLGTDHAELYVTAEQARAVIPCLSAIYDEPFADSSQIPTFLVSQLARQHVTVSLSGDAGDELFSGYNRYQLTAGLWLKLATVPLPLRRAIAGGLTLLSPQNWNRLASRTSAAARWSNVGDKLHKGAGVMTARSAAELYLAMVSQWSDPASVVIGGTEPATLLTGNQPALAGLTDVERMMALDMLTYLPDDILTKVDRAAMGVSLETRVPFLDHRVVEFAWHLPMEYKLRGGQTKWALRQVLYRHVPQALIERPKMGFGVPIDSWLRGPLREWAEDLLAESRLRQEGYFHPAPIRQKWAEHLSGQRNWQHPLWCVLTFQAWLAEQSAPVEGKT